ncbi:hypothetical protein DFH06DRAFT_989830 [Mycena polygramma]|nr:hypothetical protein DFH06DRAFT_989830 [Mycena polygramma]
MSEKKPDRSRFVFQHWVRDPKGKLLEKPPPKGARPANEIIWGHTLKDFYWISRLPGINILTIWSRSMIKEYGENFLDEEHDEEPEPRRLRPWPCLTLPDHLPASAALGYIDEGCDSMHGSSPRRIQDEIVPKPKVATKLDTNPAAVPDHASDVGSPAPASMVLVSPAGASWASLCRLWVLNNRTRRWWSEDHELDVRQRRLERGDDPSPAGFRDDCRWSRGDWYVFHASAARRISIHILDAAHVADAVPEAPTPATSDGPAADPMDIDAPKIEDSAGEEEKPSEVPEAPVAAAQEAAANMMVVDSPKIDGDVQEETKPNDSGRSVCAAVLALNAWPAAVDPCSLSPIPPGTTDAAPPAKDEANASGAAASQPDATSEPAKPVTTSASEPAAAPVVSKAPVTSPPPPPPTPEPPVFHNLPKLEEFIPEEYFPDILYVNDPDRNTMNKYYWSQRNAARPGTQEPTNLRIAHLNLAAAPCLGVGNHSVVHRAALRLPRPLSARSPTGEVTVAAKAGFSGEEARRLLLNEGKIYDAFPKHLQESWCGLNLVAPILHPVPVGAVVPKFYGYYVPREGNGDPATGSIKAKEQEQTTEPSGSWHQMSPLLLLEECGSPIVSSKFTADERSECYSLALRLHYAEFTQNSFYVRNILRQPGPLTVAPSARSDSTPSFRIIDFGRGEHWQYQQETAKKENEERRQRRAKTGMNVPTEKEMTRRIEAEEAAVRMDKKHLEQARKSYWELRDYEVRKAHSELQIRDFDY